MFFHKNPSNLFVCSFQWLRLTHRTVLLWDGGRLTGEVDRLPSTIDLVI